MHTEIVVNAYMELSTQNWGSTLESPIVSTNHHGYFCPQNSKLMQKHLFNPVQYRDFYKCIVQMSSYLVSKF